MFQLLGIIFKADRQTMKLINLTKLTTSNLLSLLGYPCMLCCMYLAFIFAVIDSVDPEWGIHPEMTGYNTSCWFGIYFLFTCFLCAVFFVLILIEFFIRKKNKTEFQLVNKIPDKYKLLHKILFWIGLFFVSPFGMFAIIFVRLKTDEYFNYSEIFLRLIDKL